VEFGMWKSQSGWLTKKDGRSSFKTTLYGINGTCERLLYKRLQDLPPTLCPMRYAILPTTSYGHGGSRQVHPLICVRLASIFVDMPAALCI